MRVLIACEESQTVCKAFRERGHEAYSCDTQECSGGHPEWHYQGDIFGLIDKQYFRTQNRGHRYVEKWDLMIGHPPCTYLSTVGNKYFNIETYGNKAIERWRQRIEGLQFFMDLWNCGIEKICLENPQGFIGTAFRKADQIIHPYYFGDRELKRTHLWLKGLPKLKHFQTSDIFDEKTHTSFPEPIYIRESGVTAGKKVYITESLYKDAKARSKTFPGIAKAMAEQWG